MQQLVFKDWDPKIERFVPSATFILTTQRNVLHVLFYKLTYSFDCLCRILYIHCMCVVTVVDDGREFETFDFNGLLF